MTESSRARLFVVRVLVLSLLLTLFGRLWYLQVVSRDTYIAAATQNGERQQFTPASRGRILDAQGNELVRNKAALVISVTRTDLPAKTVARTAVLNRLVPLVGINEGRIEAMIRPCGKGPDGKQVPRPCWTGEPFAPVPVKTFVLDAANNDDLTKRALSIEQDQADFPGVDVALRAVREYPAAGAVAGTTLAAQTLGYVAPVVQEDVNRHPDYLQPRDTIGAGGLEGTYDRDLRGTPGLLRLRVNAAGTVSDTLSDTPPVLGSDVVLNLDGTIQKATEAALQRAITVTAPSYGKHPSKGAAAVVMTTDGRVVALASYPSYDLASTFGSADGIDQTTYNSLTDPKGPLPILNRASTGVYSPGSAWKIVSSSAMLGNGLVHQGEGLACPPTIPIGPQNFHNFEGVSQPNGDLTDMLEVSCDTVFDKYGYAQWIADGQQRAKVDLPPAKEYFAKEAKAYGFGKTTGLDAGESAGSILDRAGVKKASDSQRRYNCARAKQLEGQGRTGTTEYTDVKGGCEDPGYLQGGDAAQFAIGQGFTVNVTPLQMARAYAAVANGGTLYEPTIAKAVMRPDGSLVRRVTPRKVGTVPVSASDLDYIRQGLFKVTHGKNGTAARVFAGFPVDIAGKTGTAEVHQLDAQGNDVTIGDNSWFMSFGPYKPGTGTSAKYVVAVVVPDSDQGARVAAPAARDIWTAIYNVQKRGASTVAHNPDAQAPQLLPCYVKGRTHPQKPTRGCVPKPATVVPSPAPPGFIPAGRPAGGVSALEPPLPSLPPDRRSRTSAGGAP